MKYLIAGLGNIGLEYQNTRHNIGFKILDALTGASNIVFTDKRYGFVAEMKWKARTYILLKPSTYMNRSGLAVNYWLKKENIPVENLLVVNDDIALPFGVIRLRPKGGNAGHNGLGSINEVLGTSDYSRMRFGIGNDFPQGTQSNYVLSPWSAEEEKMLPERIGLAADAIKSFGFIGITATMNIYNNK